jgi:hypothetical protein
MSNDESFTRIAEAIAQINAALTTYDSLTERCAIVRETATRLEAEIAALHRNDTGLDAKTRGREFTAANSALSLAAGDLKAAEAALAAQKTLTAATGKAAAQALIEVRDVLSTHLAAQVSARLAAEFDWSVILGVSPQDIANAHTSVRALDDLGVSQLFFQIQHDDSFTIGAVRHLDEHWRELKQLVEAEPDLELSIAPVQAPRVSKPKPTAIGNVLGTTIGAAIAA